MRGLKFWVLPAFCLVFLTTAGCGERDLSKPPKILYGRDACAQCRMIIQEDRFASAAVSADGRVLKFDDIGCLGVYANKKDSRVLRSWIHDANGGGWIEKENAKFVYSQDLVTPMGYGLAAFRDEVSAEQFAKEKNGRIILWSELMTLKQDQTDLKTEEVK